MKRPQKSCCKNFAATARVAVEEMLEEVFHRPVYTVSAFLGRERLHPKQLIVIGGPAQGLQDFLAQCFQLKCVVPPHSEVANAIGAARARLTVQATLYGDSSTGRLSIPEISCMETVGSNFSMSQAEVRLEEAVTGMAREMGMAEVPEIDFIERVQMNTVKGFSTTGKIISLKAQIRPGLAN